MATDTVDQAVQVLNATTHRGTKSWRFDAALQRVITESWNGWHKDPPPVFTVFEALTIAGKLEEIGAVRG